MFKQITCKSINVKFQKLHEQSLSDNLFNSPEKTIDIQQQSKQQQEKRRTTNEPTLSKNLIVEIEQQIQSSSSLFITDKRVPIIPLVTRRDVKKDIKRDNLQIVTTQKLSLFIPNELPVPPFNTSLLLTLPINCKVCNILVNTSCSYCQTCCQKHELQQEEMTRRSNGVENLQMRVYESQEIQQLRQNKSLYQTYIVSLQKSQENVKQKDSFSLEQSSNCEYDSVCEHEFGQSTILSCKKCGVICEQTRIIDQRKIQFQKYTHIDQKIKDKMQFSEFKLYCKELIQELPQDLQLSLDMTFDVLEIILDVFFVKGDKLLKLYVYVFLEIQNQLSEQIYKRNNIVDILGISALENFSGKWFQQGKKLYQQYKYDNLNNLLGSDDIIQQELFKHKNNKILYDNQENQQFNDNQLRQSMMNCIFKEHTRYFNISQYIQYFVQQQQFHWIFSNYTINTQAKFIILVSVYISQQILDNHQYQLIIQEIKQTDTLQKHILIIVQYIKNNLQQQFDNHNGYLTYLCQNMKFQQKAFIQLISNLSGKII